MTVVVARPVEVADDDQRILERLERLQNGGKLEPGPLRGRAILVHDGPVRDVNGAEARPRVRRGLRGRRKSRHHRLEERQGHGGAHAAQERPTVQRQLGDEHHVTPVFSFQLQVSSCELAASAVSF